MYYAYRDNGVHGTPLPRKVSIATSLHNNMLFSNFFPQERPSTSLFFFSLPLLFSLAITLSPRKEKIRQKQKARNEGTIFTCYNQTIVAPSYRLAHSSIIFFFPPCKLHRLPVSPHAPSFPSAGTRSFPPYITIRTLLARSRPTDRLESHRVCQTQAQTIIFPHAPVGPSS